MICSHCVNFKTLGFYKRRENIFIFFLNERERSVKNILTDVTFFLPNKSFLIVSVVTDGLWSWFDRVCSRCHNRCGLGWPVPTILTSFY
jgi:hypothetical protein